MRVFWVPLFGLEREKKSLEFLSLEHEDRKEGTYDRILGTDNYEKVFILTVYSLNDVLSRNHGTCYKAILCYFSFTVVNNAIENCKPFQLSGKCIHHKVQPTVGVNVSKSSS